MQFVNANYVPYTPSNFLTFDDVLILPNQSDIDSRNDPSIDTSSRFTSTLSIKVPIMSAPMDTVSGKDTILAMSEVGGFGVLHRFYSSSEARIADIKAVVDKNQIAAFAIGTSTDELEFTKSVLSQVKMAHAIVCVDVAHGHLSKSVTQIKRLRQIFGTGIQIIGGNVATPQGVGDLIQAGCNAIRVGIGPGSMCTTRITTGVGVPQLSAIIHARNVINATRTNTAIIADGGIRNSGDIVKALAAGADTVMIGGLLSGTLETPGGLYQKAMFDGNYVSCSMSPDDLEREVFPSNLLYKKYRGQSSEDFLNDIGKNGVSIEGMHTYVPCKGSISSVMKPLINGLKSGMSYLGARNMTQLNESATFIEITHAGLQESLPHGV